MYFYCVLLLTVPIVGVGLKLGGHGPAAGAGDAPGELLGLPGQEQAVGVDVDDEGAGRDGAQRRLGAPAPGADVVHHHRVGDIEDRKSVV